jgi:hypothetical protein
MEECAKWEKLLQQHGLGLYRGYNSRRMQYGLNHDKCVSNAFAMDYTPPENEAIRTWVRECPG